MKIGSKGQGGVVEGIISLVIIIFVFAVSYPIIETAVNTLQNSAGTTVDLVSAGYLPIMAVIVILSIVYYLRPGRPQEFTGITGYGS